MPERRDTRSMLVSYIRENYADILGDYVDLLEHPQGLDQITEMLQQRQRRERSR